MSLLVSLLALFLVGFIQDALSGYYLRLVNQEKYLVAAIVSFLHSMVGWGIWIWFLYQFQNNCGAMDSAQAFVYSIGGAIGNYFGIKRNVGGSVAKK